MCLNQQRRFNKSLWNYYQRIFLTKPSSSLNEKLTVVMLTYKREDILAQLLSHYCNMNDILQQIIVIWNDIEVHVPNNLLTYKCNVKLTFIQSVENKLTNRFLPRDEIATDGINTVSCIYNYSV